jgi:multiple antibiotic resistance protein
MVSYDVANIKLSEIVSVSFALFAVIDVLGSIPLLISLKKKMGYIQANIVTLVSSALILAFFFFGETLLGVMGLDVSSFAIAGSIVIFILAIEMILGVDFHKGDNDAKAGSVVPIAFPLIAGSGTLTTVMSMKTIYHQYNVLIGILINMIIIYLALKSLNRLERLLGPAGVLVIRKFFGVILLAIAVKMFRTNFAV